VEVVPTAHYMMGGVEFAADGRTAIEGLFAAGEDTGGVHGANRLGGNGVANSTVFGAIAGDAMAEWTQRERGWREASQSSLDAARACAMRPTAQPPGDLEAIREGLYETMWNDVGILRDAAGLARARDRLDELHGRLLETGVSGADLRYNLTWHDWLNLESLIAVSRSIRAAAEAREESRGAHFREDFPQTNALEQSEFSKVTLGPRREARGEREEEYAVSFEPVRFTRVRPGQTLISP
jgi:fumarate reductase flavoprotein subunit